MESRIWFITGVSTGLGQALAATAMAHGDTVLGTFRSAAQAEAFTKTSEGRGFGYVLDVTDSEAIYRVAGDVERVYGQVDVLVNNAGLGYAGAVEEASAAEVERIFSVNFRGPLVVTQAFLPMLRRQGKGHILQVSSHSGVRGFAGFGIYSASKFALEGFSEALALELAPLGIGVTLVEPGPFRTRFAGDGFVLAERTLEAYAETAGQFRQRVKGVDGKQEGDPAKAAEALVALVHRGEAPLRLPLGKIALNTLQGKIALLQEDLEAARAVASSVVFE